MRTPFRLVDTGRHFAWIALAWLGTSCATAPMHRNIRAEWRRERPDPAWMEMDIAPSNHVFVKGRVNGRESSMLVDTGAGISVVDRTFAKQLRLKRVGSMTVAGVGGRERADAVRLEAIEIGDLTLRDVLAVTLDLSPIASRIDRPLPVILGRGLFASAVVEIDYPRSRLTCHPPETFRYAGPGRTVRLRRSDSGLRTVLCQIEDLPATWFQLDTGSGKTASVFERYAEKNNLLADRFPKTKHYGGGVGGFAAETVSSLATFRFAGYVLEDVPTNFPTPKTGAFTGKSHSGNLGAGILRRFRLFIDFGRYRLHVEPGPDAHAPFPRNRLGLITEVRDGALVVLFASPGSPADKAGITTGTRIDRVDGKEGSPAELATRLREVSRQPEGRRVRIREANGREHTIALQRHYSP